MTESPGQSGLDASPHPAKTGASMFTIASQLITQLVGLIEGPPGKFSSRIAVLHTIHEAWTSNREVTVRIEDSSPDQVTGHGQTVMGKTEHADGALDYSDEDERSATGSVEMVIKESPGRLLNSTEVFAELGRNRACVNLRRLDVKTEGEDVFDDKGQLADVLDSPSLSPQQTTVERLLCKKCGNEFLLGEGSPDRPFACPCCQLGSSLQVASLSDDGDGESGVPAHPVTSEDAVQVSNGHLECHICSKRCRNQTQLENHIRIHNKDNLYSCKYCNKTFPTPYYRNKHQTIHRVKPRHRLRRGCQSSEDQSVQNTSLSTPTPVAHSGSSGEPKPSLETLNSPTESSQRYLDDVAPSSDAELDMHLRRQGFSCRICGIVLPTRSDLMQHRKGHNYGLSKPGARVRKAVTNSMMAIHKKYVKLGKAKGNYQCPSCSKVLFTARGFQNHMKSHTNQKCEICHKTFNSAANLREHRLIHTGEKRYECPLCSNKFTQRSHLSSHWMYVHKRDVLRCGQCIRIFFQLDKLKEHEKAHHKGIKPHKQAKEATHNGDKQFVCPLCSNKFTQRGHLSSHWMHVHKRDVLRCGQCIRIFFQLDKLKDHEQKKHPHGLDDPDKPGNPSKPAKRRKRGNRPKREKLFSCSECQKGFTRQHDLMRHRKNVHMIVFRCVQCGRHFHNQDQLDAHHKMKHLSQSPGKSNSPNFREERRTRSQTSPSKIGVIQGKEKPVDKLFQCPHCEKKLKSKTTLIEHTRIHTNEKPFICPDPLCGKAFSHRGGFSRHKKLHQTSMACTFCKEVFPTKASLDAHLQNQHGAGTLVVQDSYDFIDEANRCSANKTKQSESPVKALSPQNTGGLSCKYCFQLFSSKKRLVTHEERHTGNGSVWECRLCKKKCPSASHLKQHMIVHDKKKVSSSHTQRLAAKKVKKARQKGLVKNFECRHCRKAFRYPSQLAIHERTHTKEFPCQICRVIFKSLSALDGHHKTEHAHEERSHTLPDSGRGRAVHPTSPNGFSGHQSPILSPVRRGFNATTSPGTCVTGRTGSPVRQVSATNQSGSPGSSYLRTGYILGSNLSSPQAVSTNRQATASDVRSHQVDSTKVKLFTCVCRKYFTSKSALNFHKRSDCQSQ